MRILIGDDAPFIREVIRNILMDQSVQFLPDACDGEEVVTLAKRHKPDLIFLDLSMPKKNGITACEEILQVLPDTKIVIVSSLHDESLVQKAIEIGCVDYIKKPFEVTDILSVLKHIHKAAEVVNG
ncbi:MAG: response regulator [Bdellovibrionales bacterium]|nr:response regulator [Bdellovibrionales bacterium]